MKTASRCFAILVAASALIPASALACTPVRECYLLTDASPVDGATDVATTAELRLDYKLVGNQQPVEALAPQLEDSAGSPVAVAWTREKGALRGRPTSSLQPGSVYRLRQFLTDCSQLAAGQNSCGLCASEQGTVVSTFTIGITADQSAPQPIAITSNTRSSAKRVSEPSECGPYVRCDVTVSWSGAQADDVLRFYNGSDFMGQFAASDGHVVIAVYRPGSTRGGEDPAFTQVGDASYRIVVVDPSGNESEATEVSVPACGSDTEEGVAQDSGCVVRQSGRTGALATVLLLGLSVLLLRRRAKRG